MKFCSKCGNKLSDSMKFCNKCGAKVKSVDKDTENNSNPEDAKNISNIENNIDKTIILDAPKIKKEINTDINENIKNNLKPIHNSNFNNKEKCLDASFDDDLDDDLDENFNDESCNNENTDNFKHSNTKKKILISIFTLVAFVIIGTSIYF